MQENGAEQPKVYRHTRTMLKIRSTPTDGEQRTQMREWSTETRAKKFYIPAIPDGNRNCLLESSQEHSSPSGLTPLFPTNDLPESENVSEDREESSPLVKPLCMNGTTLGTPEASSAPGTCKSTRENFGKPAKSIVTNFTCKDTIAT